MRLYVGNLCFDMSSADLEKVFSEYGEVSSANVITDTHAGQTQRFGFVEMASDDVAKAAITAADGKYLAGREMKVNDAKPQRTGGSGGEYRRGGGHRDRC